MEDDSEGHHDWNSSSGSEYGSELQFESSDSDTARNADEEQALRVLLPPFSVVGVYDTLREAERARDTRNEFYYTYDTRYITDHRQGTVSLCRSHVQCQHRLKVITLFGDTFLYQLAEGGQHTEALSNVTRRGVHPDLRDEVDSLLRMGWGAGRLRSLLNQQYASQHDVLAIIPTIRQLEYRKAYHVRNSPGGWDLINYASFNGWASQRLCNTREAFLEVSDEANPRMDELIILDSFEFDGGASFGVIVSSRRVFKNVLKSVRDQGAELSCATDGTYKLHFGGWTVVDCGTEAVTWTAREPFTHRFVPWAYMFVRTETTEAYARMFEVIRLRAQEFFDVEVEVAYASLDHSEAIASAFLEVWPRVQLLTCWPHLLRQARKKRSLLTDLELFADMVMPQLRYLRSARSHAQFLRMSVIITTHWITEGQREYAEWFRTVYLVNRWDQWHVNGAGIAGVIPSQQGIEAHHNVIKKTCVPSARASTSGVLQGILSRILKADGETLCPDTVNHYTTGPIPPEMLVKAHRFTVNGKNFRRVHQGKGRRKRLVAFLFNATRHMVDGANVLAAPVDAHRARRFTNSLGGHVPNGISANELQYELLSLHRVTVSQNTITEPIILSPVWTSDQVSSIRRYLKCTCEQHVRSGWVCSHVLAALSLLELLNIDAAISRVSVRRAPGRPRSRRSALTREDEQNGYFEVNRLRDLFIRRPGQPLQWKIVDDFEITTDEGTETSSFVGVVTGLRMADAVYVWSARFDQDAMRDYDVLELARVVHKAHALGVNVTG